MDHWRSPNHDDLHAITVDPGVRGVPVLEVVEVDGFVTSAIDGMLDLMRRAHYTALSGPVVGLPLRVIAIDLTGTGRSQVVLINPVIEKMSTERQRDREGCLAIPGVTGPVDRSAWVVASGLAPSGHLIRFRAGGMLARMIQHQVDHLDGYTFVDHMPWRARALIHARLGRRAGSCALPAHAWS